MASKYPLDGGHLKELFSFLADNLYLLSSFFFLSTSTYLPTICHKSLPYLFMYCCMSPQIITHRYRIFLSAPPFAFPSLSFFFSLLLSNISLLASPLRSPLSLPCTDKKNKELWHYTITSTQNIATICNFLHRSLPVPEFEGGWFGPNLIKCITFFLLFPFLL